MKKIKFSEYYANKYNLPMGQAGDVGELYGPVIERLANAFIEWADIEESPAITTVEEKKLLETFMNLYEDINTDSGQKPKDQP